MIVVMKLNDSNKTDFCETDSSEVDFAEMDSIRISKAIEALRVRAFLSDVTLGDIAQQVKQSKTTVGKKLKRLDMSLSDFCAFSRAIGVNPVRLLSDVFKEEL